MAPGPSAGRREGRDRSVEGAPGVEGHHGVQRQHAAGGLPQLRGDQVALRGGWLGGERGVAWGGGWWGVCACVGVLVLLVG